MHSIISNDLQSSEPDCWASSEGGDEETKGEREKWGDERKLIIL